MAKRHKPNKETDTKAKLTKEVFAVVVETRDDVDEVLEKHTFWRVIRSSAWIMCYKCYNPDLFTADLATNSDQLLSIFSEEDINHKLATFNDTFLSTLDTHAPIKTIRIRSRPCPRITPEIKDQMTSRAQLFRCYRQSRNADDWRAYKEARRSVKQLLKNAVCDYICREVQLHKDNPGSLWKIIHTCIPSKEKESPVYSRDTELVANNFKQLFVSVGRNAAQTAAQLAIVNDINTSDTSLFSPPTI
ncbi:hypothetical protein P5673_025703, partial [Acropora cervicornis]